MQKVIGFDLDGVFVDHPPGISFSVLDFLYKDQKKQELSYRLPSVAEQQIRRLSHLPFVRPQISKNCDYIKKVKDKYNLYLISGRFGFLEDLTRLWLKKNGMDNIFRKVCLNSNNEQPHLFKDRMLEFYKIEAYCEDDFDSIAFLSERHKKIKFYWYTDDQNVKLRISNIVAIKNLEEIFQ